MAAGNFYFCHVFRAPITILIGAELFVKRYPPTGQVIGDPNSEVATQIRVHRSGNRNSSDSYDETTYYHPLNINFNYNNDSGWYWHFVFLTSDEVGFMEW